MIGDSPKIVLFDVRQLQKGRLELLKSLDSHLGKLHAIFQRSQRWSTELPFLGRIKQTTSLFFFSSYTSKVCTYTTDHSNPCFQSTKQKKRHLKMSSIINQAAFLLPLQSHSSADIFFPLFRLSQVNTKKGKDFHLTLSQGTTAQCIYAIIIDKNSII